MRIWSIHPKYLDAKGLVALWREAILAKNVLLDKTNAYINHSQLIRFKNHFQERVELINHYLLHVYKESLARGYNFNQEKVEVYRDSIKEISVNSFQLEYEFNHLQNKLKTRNEVKYQDNLKLLPDIIAHPIFYIVNGGIEVWEVIPKNN